MRELMIRQRPVIIIGAIAVLVCVVGAFISWPAFLRSWLAATLTWGALPVGALAVLMTHALTGGAWGERSYHLWRALTATLPLFALAMLPLLFGLWDIFSWARSPEALPEAVRHKLLYFNEPFLLLRWLVYFAAWGTLAWAHGIWGGRVRAVSAPGLVLWAFALTFFGFDWLMSLEPRFYSDVFGLMLITGAPTSAMAAGLVLLGASVPIQARQDLANVWLAVLLGWAFMIFAQLIIIWSGNIPDEIVWYAHRRVPPWGVIGLLAFALYCGIPFCALLSTAAKQRLWWIRGVAVSCLAGHVLYIQWLVLPAFEHWQSAQYWLAPASLIAVGAGFVLIIAGRLGSREERHG